MSGALQWRRTGSHPRGATPGWRGQPARARSVHERSAGPGWASARSSLDSWRPKVHVRVGCSAANRSRPRPPGRVSEPLSLACPPPRVSGISNRQPYSAKRRRRQRAVTDFRCACAAGRVMQPGWSCHALRRRMSILIVEDSRTPGSSCRILAATLPEIHEAGSAGGVCRLAGGGVDLILLDVSCRAWTLWAVRRIGEDPRLATSGDHVTAGDGSACSRRLRRGAADLMQNPSRASRLRARVPARPAPERETRTGASAASRA
jgi:hypothetical protein